MMFCSSSGWVSEQLLRLVVELRFPQQLKPGFCSESLEIRVRPDPEVRCGSLPAVGQSPPPRPCAHAACARP